MPSKTPDSWSPPPKPTTPQEKVADDGRRYVYGLTRTVQIARFRTRLAFERIIAFAGVIYGVNVLFNLVQLAVADGWHALADPATLAHAFLLDLVATLASRGLVALLPELVVALLLLLPALARVWVYRGSAVEWLAERVPDYMKRKAEAEARGLPVPEPPKLPDTGLWRTILLASRGSNYELEQYAGVRGDLLQQIKEWLRTDAFLREGTKEIIREIEHRQAVTQAVVWPALAIIGARLLLLASQH